MSVVGPSVSKNFTVDLMEGPKENSPKKVGTVGKLRSMIGEFNDKYLADFLYECPVREIMKGRGLERSFLLERRHLVLLCSTVILTIAPDPERKEKRGGAEVA